MSKPPTEAADKNSMAGRFIEKHGIEAYRREYNAGWKASSHGGESSKWQSGNYTDAWEDGYLDMAAGRPKWHLPHCPDHDHCGQG